MTPVPSTASLSRISRDAGVARVERRKKPRTSFRRFVAVFGYESIGRLTVDPLRRGPRMWFDEIREPRGGRTHIDVAVPNRLAEARVAAVRAAGGRLADDSHAPDWWTVASPENHGVHIAAWGDIDDGA